jgi:cephalosporin hydroxylase
VSVLPGYDPGPSVAACGRQVAAGCVKVAEDLERYRRVIAATRPEVLVECGTQTGASARWFAGQGLDRVVTIDIDPAARDPALSHPRVTYLTGDSADPQVVEAVRVLAGGRRAMAVLDSDHAADHVEREIRLYGPLVSPGCYLVVEDGICRWLHPGGREDPLLALERTLLADAAGFVRDVEIEALFPVTLYPAGWWRREAP